VGYHNEHHDFPYIPGSRLARLRALAPEFYDTLLSHSSWSAVLRRFVTAAELGGFSRIKRRRGAASADHAPDEPDAPDASDQAAAAATESAAR
jgi:fatty acid desaturase